MKYKVHRFEIDMPKDRERLEQFMYNIEGEIVSIIPHVKPTFQLMGATSKVDFLLIVEKIMFKRFHTPQGLVPLRR
ncbi:hypothetical protein EH221_05980 [bacterium]|nr:MAG: hypothetical protein EH221_05980 [bacterium]